MENQARQTETAAKMGTNRHRQFEVNRLSLRTPFLTMYYNN